MAPYVEKERKKAITSTIALLISWPVGLDKFLEDESGRGFQIFLGQLISGIVFTYGLFEYIKYIEKKNHIFLLINFSIDTN